MTRFAPLALTLVGLLASTSPAQVLFSYEDLDPDATSPVGGGVTITDRFFDAERPNVGAVDVGTGTGPFMSLLTDPATIDVSSFIGKSFSASAETLIPSLSTINAGDSVYLQVDYFNEAIGAAGAGNFVRSTNGFYNEGSPRDSWLPLAVDGFVPAMTDNGGAVDRANVSVVIVDGGFGGIPNDSGAGDFALLDNFSYVIQEPLPPNPVFFSEDAPSDANMVAGGVLFEAAQDPLDAANDVGLVLFGGSGTFVNVNMGPPADATSFEGQKFRASFDYLVPADTALEPGEDTFWVQVGFNDPASESTPQGGGNSTSAGFPNPENVADGQWRTIEVTGEIPPDTNGAFMSIVMSDDGFLGGPADTFGTGFYIDNVIFEALETLDGDFNDDGVVDAADYTVWRDNDGAEAPAAPFEYRDAVELSGERSINFAGNGAGGVNGDDRTVWANNYGSPVPASSAIPEPGAGLLLLMGIVSASLRRDGVARRSEVERTPSV